MDTKVFRDITYGMYIVTTKFNDINAGCIINTLSQVTSTPHIISINLNKSNYTNEIIKKSKRFNVSIISEQIDKDIISLFGYKTSKEVNKFEIEHTDFEGIKTIENGVTGILNCEVINIVDTQTHDIIIAKVINSKKISEDKPMTYKYYHEVLKGTSPKNAPTFISEVKKGEYRCPICGYVYNNETKNIKFEDLSEDYKCPLCQAPKNLFEEIK